MPAAHAYGGPVGVVGDLCGCVLLGGVAGAELSVGVESPAIKGACADAAAVVVLGGECGPAVVGSDAGGCAECFGCAGDAERAGVGCAPAVELSGADGAGVLEAGADVGPVVVGADFSGCFGVEVVGFAGAEASVYVLAPAKEFAGTDGAGVAFVGGDGGPVIFTVVGRGDAGGCGLFVFDGFIAELSEGILAPAIKLAVAHGAGVVLGGGDGLPVGVGGDPARDFLVVGGAGAELVVGVAAPAKKFVQVGEGAGVCITCGYGFPVVNFVDESGGVFGGGVVDAESVEIVAAPAIEFLVLDGAGVVLAGADVGPVVFGADLLRNAQRCFVAGSEFSEGSVAPAIEFSGLDCAGVVLAGADVGPGIVAADGDGRIAVADGVDSELAIGIFAPAIEFSVLEGAGEFVAGGDVGPVADVLDGGGLGFGEVVGVAELSAVVFAPAIELVVAGCADVVLAGGDVVPVGVVGDGVGGEHGEVGVVEIVAPAVEFAVGGDGARVLGAGRDFLLENALGCVAVYVGGVRWAGVGLCGGVGSVVF